MTPAVEMVDVRVFAFPTPVKEGDGTFAWDKTTAVTVQLTCGGITGLGWSFTSGSASALIREHLEPVVSGADPRAVSDLHEQMRRTCRNLGTKGLVGQAISAVDVALWDLKARLLEVPLGVLLGARPDASVPAYGSGGFTTLDEDELREQVQMWLAAGCQAVKIKVGESWGTRVDRDLARAAAVREMVGPDVALMVDANGGYTRGQARRVGAAYDDLGIVWFEEPVSCDDLEGLAVVRAALRCDIAAGEYASDLYDAQALCPVVDCLQLDATRCGGYTGWLRAAAVAASHGLQVSAHCAPALHSPVVGAAPNVRNVEWFVDHVRLEPKLLSGVAPVTDGRLHQSPGPGHGMTLNPDAEQFAVG